MNPSDLLALIKTRQSVRAYTDRPVEKFKIQNCLEAARLAPSACNAQPWTFVLVDRPELRHQLADLTADYWLPLNHWTKQAPVLVVLVVERPNLTSRLGAAVKKRDFAWMDVAIAAEHFCLQAAAQGLGTCMLGWFKEEKVKRLLNIPDARRVALLITLGYAASEVVRPKIRKALNTVARWNTYA